MWEGKKPSGCQYCWNIESSEEQHISDRHEKNAANYTTERLEEILKYKWSYDVNPRYVELSF